MTQAGARVLSARRTVRIALALVTGQALLCAVIGWVTFGTPDDRRSGPRGPITTLTDPPFALPQLPAAAPSGSPSTARPRRSAGSVDRSPVRSTARATRSARPPASVRARPRPVTPSAATPSTARPTKSSLPAAPPADPEPSGGGVGFEAPVVVGQRCDRRGELELTEDGVEVRCTRDRAGVLRWQID